MCDHNTRYDRDEGGWWYVYCKTCGASSSAASTAVTADQAWERQTGEDRWVSIGEQIRQSRWGMWGYKSA